MVLEELVPFVGPELALVLEELVELALVAEELVPFFVAELVPGLV